MITALVFPGHGLQDDVLREIERNPVIERILIVSLGATGYAGERLESIHADGIYSGELWNGIVGRVSSRYMLYIAPGDVRPDLRAPERLASVADETGSGIVYADYADSDGNLASDHPVNDYQAGSIRDDFDFGPLILIETRAARDALANDGGIPPGRWAGWYDLRLKIATRRTLFHLPENLCTVVKTVPGKTEGDLHHSGTSGGYHFAYVDPRNRQYQEECEEAATRHLKRTGAWLKPVYKKIPESGQSFPVEASVVIPVRNRARTVADAVKSALAQKADFSFNVIVVDNHSTDGTTGILAALAAQNPPLKHIVPRRLDLSIGGCWNEAIDSDGCGRYAVQLDSDDLYAGDDVLQRMVEMLRKENCAMVVGAYTIVDAALREIPPGLIDHREWSEGNGRNNLLRVNGIGAPRAFDTAMLRRHRFPNVGYGEDYAVALRLSREYRIGRIYESLYLCRRWEGNTDASPTLSRLNRFNAYKDRLRTIEITARQAINTKGANRQ